MLEPWAYSPNGFTVLTAIPGEVLELPEPLAMAGIDAGALEAEGVAEWIAAPENAALTKPALEKASDGLDPMNRAQLRVYAREKGMGDQIDLSESADDIRAAIRALEAS